MMPGRAHQFRCALGEADLAQRIGALHGRAESTTRWRRLRCARIATPRYRIEQQLPGNIVIRLGPKTEGDAAADAQHPMRLAQRERRSWHVVNTEVRYHRIECTVVIRKRLGIALVEPDRTVPRL